MERFTLCVLLLFRCVFTQTVDVNFTDDATGINAGTGLKLQPNRFGISFQAVNQNCAELLQMFRQTYVTFTDCLLTYARPVRICQNCFMGFKSLEGIYRNISTDNPGNGSCLDSLVRSDRLMLLYSLYSQTDDIWTSAGCKRCLTNNTDALSNDTLHFLTTLNQSLSCFEKYVGNHSELCKDCKASYTRLNEVYARKEKNHTLCIDLEDSMNMTRQMWSKSFGCSFPREETVPVLAVSSFMLFLPVIFYLSSFLHSEQKKRKLIHPSRVKTSSSLMNIQDKSS